MASRKLRSFMKAFIWETSMFLLTTLFIWWYLNDLSSSLKINIVITFFKVILLFFYERTWKKIRWGKFKKNKI